MTKHTAGNNNLEPDQTLDQELAAVEDVTEMVNLFPEDSGIEGVIFVSTAMGSHGPGVKYSLKAGRDQSGFSVSIGTKPRLLANSLPDHVVNKVAPKVIAWVAMNCDALLDFWNSGTTWSHRDVSRFVENLKKLPSA